MEPLALGLDSDADAAGGRAGEPARAPGAGPAGEAVAVDWTRPPYRVGSFVRLVLEGEDPAAISRATVMARTAEYYRQLRAQAAHLDAWELEDEKFRDL